jgi:glycine/D-amino acid oxidase-like deaminating enzyme
MPDEEWDTLVIGAGVIGCATAYHIKRTDPDQRVLLLDRADRPALGNTRRSVALFRDLFTSSTNRDLASSTIALYDHVEDEMGHTLGLRRYGYYWLMDGDRLSSLRDKIADLERGGSDLEVHDREDVVARMGEGLVLEPGAPEGRGPMAPVDGALLARNGGNPLPNPIGEVVRGRVSVLGGEGQVRLSGGQARPRIGSRR